MNVEFESALVYVKAVMLLEKIGNRPKNVETRDTPSEVLNRYTLIYFRS